MIDNKRYTFNGTSYNGGVWEDEALETGGCYSYGDFQEFKGTVTEALQKSLFIMPSLLSGSDYSGGSVEKSNFRVFKKQFKDVEGVYETSGGYNTFAIVIRLDVYETNKEIKETIDALDDYPLIDEEDHSQLHTDWDGQYMTDNILGDLCRVIDLEMYIPDYDTFLEDTEKLEHIAWDGINELNLEFIHETNSSSFRDEHFDKLKKYVEDILLIEHCTKLPLLINREWSCEKNEQLFKEKFNE